MSNKTVQELLQEARNAGSAARGEEPRRQSGGESVFKSFISKHIYDLGDAPPITGEEVLNDPQIASVDFDITPGSDAGNKPFSEIYAEAGIVSEYSVDQFEELINSDEIKSQPVAMKQIAIPFTLKAMGVTVDAPILDATRRDAALDSYAESLLASTTQAATENRAREESIDAEMKAYFDAKQAEIEALRQDTVAKEAAYQTFLDRKREEEDRMVRIIQPFLNGQPNPVTVGNEPTLTSSGVLTQEKSASKG